MENWKCCSSSNVLIFVLSGSEPTSVLCPVTNLSVNCSKMKVVCQAALDFVSELWKVWKLYSTSLESFLKHTKLFHFDVLRLLPGFTVSGVTTTFFFFFVMSLLLQACYFPQPFGRTKFTCFDRKSRFLSSAYHELQDVAPRQVRSMHTSWQKAVISRKARSTVLLFLAVNISLRTESWLQVAQRESNLCERKALGTPVRHIKGLIAASIRVGSVLSPLQSLWKT